MLEPLEPVTVCDQFVFFFLVELKFKVLWETFDVALNSLVERFRGDAVKRSQVSIDQHRLRSECQDEVVEGFAPRIGQCVCFSHANSPTFTSACLK